MATKVQAGAPVGRAGRLGDAGLAARYPDPVWEPAAAVFDELVRLSR